MDYEINLPIDQFKTLDFTIVARNVAIHGELHLQGHAIIAGEVEGKINFKDKGLLVIERTARVTGTIQADHIEVAGCFDGEIFASGALIIYPGAEVSGKVTCKNLSIYPGSVADIEAQTLS